MYPSYNGLFTKEIKVGDKVVNITIGKFSEQASAAVLAQCGDTVVHTTVALGGESNLGYFPLSVEFIEKLYAGGIIKGSRWVKRDGRPSDASVLKSRVIDRSIRPLFHKDFMREVQVINTVFSFDKENPDDMIGMLATGIALEISDIPFDGPISGVRVGYKKEEKKFIFNPTITEQEGTDLDLIVSGTKDSVVMVEAGANEVTEEVMIEALGLAGAELSRICTEIADIASEIGKAKLEFTPDNTSLIAKRDLLMPLLTERLDIVDVITRQSNLEDVKLNPTFEEIAELEEVVSAEMTVKDVKEIWEEMVAAMIRKRIVEDGVRPDGRKNTEIRKIDCEVDVFPRTHGSAMFKRGVTQAVTITTLGSPSLGQYIEDMGGEDVRRYMHFYNMPPYASGEAGRVGSPKRREVGHGALAERALAPVIPSQEEFPYTIQVVSEILSSNGSTSQAAVCGSTLSLMAAGVPIKRPVAGIAMGLIINDKDNYKVLSDIKDVEDHFGDMDFKVAGSAEGITALQMDIKVKGLSLEILTNALNQAKEGRLHILGEMLKTITTPREELSVYAPKIKQITIPADKIGELIGPGGKVIKGIIEESGAQIDIEEDEEKKVGLVNITSPDQEKIDAAVAIIQGVMYEPTVGDEFDGEVVRIEAYGAFVNYAPGKDGLVHVSSMAADYVADPNQIVKLGDTVHVRISEIQDDGKVKLSMLTAEEEEAAKAARPARPSRDFKGGFRDGGRGGNRGGDRGGRGGDRRGGNRGGDRGGSRGDSGLYR
ncbi:MAG: polyribonucleotide nucleotidyltransferase [Pseudomonadales bacterium]|jgi:polyribonucleotide nucleotidyltransferase|nr:polyribonucleotide nucleotidyltransferase [Pseudomonadales bacterium]